MILTSSRELEAARTLINSSLECSESEFMPFVTLNMVLIISWLE